MVVQNKWIHPPGFQFFASGSPWLILNRDSSTDRGKLRFRYNLNHCNWSYFIWFWISLPQIHKIRPSWEQPQSSATRLLMQVNGQERCVPHVRWMIPLAVFAGLASITPVFCAPCGYSNCRIDSSFPTTHPRLLIYCPHYQIWTHDSTPGKIERTHWQSYITKTKPVLSEVMNLELRTQNEFGHIGTASDRRSSG